MVLRPVCAPSVSQDEAVRSAWSAIEETQRRTAPDYFLVAQTDHAALAGAIAAALGPPLLPALSPEIERGIGVHDDGWAAVDARTPCLNGKPLSFLDLPPSTFLAAWTGSIERAMAVAPMAGAIVSRHFWRLGTGRLSANQDAAEDRRSLSDFLAHEQSRQQELTKGVSHQEFEFLTDILQFSDVLSLYLCCGAEADVEFPQEFSGSRCVLRRIKQEGRACAVCRFQPTPLRNGTDLAVAARRFSDNTTVQFPFLLY